MIARLEDGKKEYAALRTIKESIECSDKVTKVCRYAYYLDLVKRLDVTWATTEKYSCELVDKVKELNTLRQDVAAAGKDLSVLQDLLARVTKLRDDLETGWLSELCRLATAGSVPDLPPEITKACAKQAAAA